MVCSVYIYIYKSHVLVFISQLIVRTHIVHVCFDPEVDRICMNFQIYYHFIEDCLTFIYIFYLANHGAPPCVYVCMGTCMDVYIYMMYGEMDGWMDEWIDS